VARPSRTALTLPALVLFAATAAARQPATGPDLAAVLPGIDAASVRKKALERGLLINRTATTVIRLLPPYIVTEQDVDEGLAILDDAIRSLGW